MRERRRQQIDPKKLRKHSQIIEQRSDPVMVVGEREQTDYGFFIDGHKGKSFETKFILIMPSCMTPTWLHEKKSRVVRIVGGIGQYQTFAEDGTVTTKPVTVGDEIVIEPGTTYRIVSSPSKLECYVTQDSKYEASLKEIAPAEVVANVSPDDLTGISAADKAHRITMGTDRSSRRNRAREQIAAQRGEAPIRSRQRRMYQSEESFFNSTAAGDINVMPVMDFDPDGAG